MTVDGQCAFTDASRSAMRLVGRGRGRAERRVPQGKAARLPPFRPPFRPGKLAEIGASFYSFSFIFFLAGLCFVWRLSSLRFLFHSCHSSAWRSVFLNSIGWEMSFANSARQFSPVTLDSFHLHFFFIISLLPSDWHFVNISFKWN